MLACKILRWVAVGSRRDARAQFINEFEYERDLFVPEWACCEFAHLPFSSSATILLFVAASSALSAISARSDMGAFAMIALRAAS